MMMVKKFTIMMGSSMRIIVTVMERPQHNATVHDTRAATLKLDIVCRLELLPSWLTEVSGWGRAELDQIWSVLDYPPVSSSWTMKRLPRCATRWRRAWWRRATTWGSGSWGSRPPWSRLTPESFFIQKIDQAIFSQQSIMPDVEGQLSTNAEPVNMASSFKVTMRHIDICFCTSPFPAKTFQYDIQ